MNINQLGIDLIKLFEGRKLTAYQDQAGIWTIGYGHTGPEVVKGLTWSVDEAEQMLLQDISSKAEPIRDFISEMVNDNQFSALCSLCFNVGLHRVIKSNTLKLINSGEDPSVEWMGFCLVNGEPNNGLLRRRKAELDLYHKLG